MQLLIAVVFIAITEVTGANEKTFVRYAPDKILQQKVDVYPDHFNVPVPFGHVFKDGYGDPRSNLKAPIDLLEMDMKTPKDKKEAEEILKKGGKNIQWIRKNRPQTSIKKQKYSSLGSPRDAFIDEKTFKLKDEADNVTTKVNETKPWFDWSYFQNKNMGITPNHRMNRLKEEINRRTQPMPKITGQFFASNSFDITSGIRENRINKTTCSQFARGADFHPKDIVDIDWVPFYIWSSRFHIATTHRFSYPTKKLVKKYKEQFGQYLNRSIDWEQPKLVMKEMMEMLLIAADRTGLFIAIPYQDIPEITKKKILHLPTIMIRFKIIDPYLAMMFCDDDFATIMAVSGNEPTMNRDKISEAKTLKFKGAGYAVSRDIVMENLRIQAEKEWEVEREESKHIKINEPIIRSHFFGSER